MKLPRTHRQSERKLIEFVRSWPSEPALAAIAHHNRATAADLGLTADELAEQVDAAPSLHAALALIGLTSQARPDLEGAMAGRELFDGDRSLGVYTASEAWDLVRARSKTYPLSVLTEETP